MGVQRGEHEPARGHIEAWRRRANYLRDSKGDPKSSSERGATKASLPEPTRENAWRQGSPMPRNLPSTKVLRRPTRTRRPLRSTTRRLVKVPVGESPRLLVYTSAVPVSTLRKHG